MYRCSAINPDDRPSADDLCGHPFLDHTFPATNGNSLSAGQAASLARPDSACSMRSALSGVDRLAVYDPETQHCTYDEAEDGEGDEEAEDPAVTALNLELDEGMGSGDESDEGKAGKALATAVGAPLGRCVFGPVGLAPLLHEQPRAHCESRHRLLTTWDGPIPDQID